MYIFVARRAHCSHYQRIAYAVSGVYTPPLVNFMASLRGREKCPERAMRGKKKKRNDTGARGTIYLFICNSKYKYILLSGFHGEQDSTRQDTYGHKTPGRASLQTHLL